jgi:hypothetical protein
MNSNELRTRMLQVIGLTKANDELQDGFVYAYERIARRRMGYIIRPMLSDEQADQIQHMRESGRPDAEVVAWIKSQLAVDFDTLYRSVLQAVVTEVYQTPTK